MGMSWGLGSVAATVDREHAKARLPTTWLDVGGNSATEAHKVLQRSKMARILASSERRRIAGAFVFGWPDLGRCQLGELDRWPGQKAASTQGLAFLLCYPQLQASFQRRYREEQERDDR